MILTYSPQITLQLKIINPEKLASQWHQPNQKNETNMMSLPRAQNHMRTYL